MDESMAAAKMRIFIDFNSNNDMTHDMTFDVICKATGAPMVRL
jgi:hypothetical protein